MVDNKPGGAGTIAVREVLRAPPDGHTILLANIGMLAVNPYAMKDAGYNPPTDIAPVCLAVDFSNVLVVHPSVPATRSPTISSWGGGPRASTTAPRASAAPAISPASCCGRAAARG